MKRKINRDKPVFYKIAKHPSNMRVKKNAFIHSKDYIENIYSIFKLGNRITNKEDFKKNYIGKNVEKDWKDLKKRDLLIQTGQYEKWRDEQYYNDYMKKFYDVYGGTGFINEDEDEDDIDENELLDNKMIKKFYNLSLDEFKYLSSLGLLPNIKDYYPKNIDTGELFNISDEINVALQSLKSLKSD